MSFKNLTLEEFTEELAGGSATPGGGSVAALATALSSSLLKMVINLTEDNAELDSFSSDLNKDIRDALHLIDRDCDSFDEVMEAYKLPGETEEEKSKRRQAIEEGLKNATMTPFDTMKVSFKLLQISLKVAKEGNKNAISDAGVAGFMAYSAVNGAYFNVKINTSSIEDEEFKDPVNKEAEKMMEESNQMIAQLEDYLKEQI